MAPLPHPTSKKLNLSPSSARPWWLATRSISPCVEKKKYKIIVAMIETLPFGKLAISLTIYLNWYPWSTLDRHSITISIVTCSTLDWHSIDLSRERPCKKWEGSLSHPLVVYFKQTNWHMPKIHHQASFARNFNKPLSPLCCLHKGFLFIICAPLGICSW